MIRLHSLLRKWLGSQRTFTQPRLSSGRVWGPGVFSSPSLRTQPGCVPKCPLFTLAVFSISRALSALLSAGGSQLASPVLPLSEWLHPGRRDGPGKDLPGEFLGSDRCSPAPKLLLAARSWLSCQLPACTLRLRSEMSEPFFRDLNLGVDFSGRGDSFELSHCPCLSP